MLTANPWTCVLCGHEQISNLKNVHREGTECTCCGSTWRNRAITYGLLRGFNFPELPVSSWNPDWSISGVGFDDHPSIFSNLPTRISYTNTHLDRYPQLDLRNPPPVAQGSLSFVLCSDVLEHVVPPVGDAISGIKSILKPGGVAVISVPVLEDSNAPTDEYYPGLRDYEIQSNGELEWIDETGLKHRDESPEYHGGTGLVLSFRTFGSREFRAVLLNAGFKVVEELPPCQGLGVFEIDNHGVFLAFA